MTRRFFNAVSAFLIIALAGCGSPSTESTDIEPVTLAAVPTVAPVPTVAAPTFAPIPVATPTPTVKPTVKRKPQSTKIAPVSSESLAAAFPVQETTSSRRSSRDSRSSRRARTEDSRSQSPGSSTRRTERIARQPEREAVAQQGGQVWVNSNSDVYHMPGMRWYGNTKEGYYTTEEKAISAGFRRAMR